MAKRIITPWAENGDKDSIPETPVGLLANWQSGYPSSYEEDPGTPESPNPNARFVERDVTNQIYNDITSNIQEWQNRVYPEFVSPTNNGGTPVSYDINAKVYFEDVLYRSLKNNNTDLIGEAGWIEDSNSASLVANDNGGSVQDYINSNIPALDSTLDIPSLSGRVSGGERVNWMGYYSVSDGGSNWGVVKSGAHTADGGSIFSIDTNTYVEANLEGESLNIRKFGATEGVDSSGAIQNALDYVLSFADKKGLYVSGNFTLSSGLSITDIGRSSNLSISGDSYTTSSLVFENVDTPFTSRNFEFVQFKDITIDGGDSVTMFDLEKRPAVADLDFKFTSCALINSDVIVRAAGRGIVFEGGVIGLCGTALDIISVEGFITDNEKSHSMRHYTFYGVRVDNIDLLIRTPETGDTATYINDIQIVGNDFYNMRRLMTVGLRVMGVTVSGNNAIASCINGVIYGKYIERLNMVGNVIQGEFDNSVTTNPSDPIPFGVSVENYIIDSNISDNIFNGVSGNFVKSLGATSSLSITNNTLASVWDYDDGSTGKMFFSGVGGDASLVITNNKLRAVNVTGNRYRVLDETLYSPENVTVYSNESTGFDFEVFRGSYLPPFRVGGTGFTYDDRSGWYIVDDDYIYGTGYVEATQLAGAGDVTIGLPVTAVVDNEFGDFSGSMEILDISGLALPEGESFSHGICGISSSFLMISTSTGVRRMQGTDLTLDVTVKFTYKYRFK